MRAALLVLLALAQFPIPQARQALNLGRTNDDSMFESFNRGYELATFAPVTHAEVITEFRRAVLLVREKYNIGEYGMTERDLVKAMVPYEGKVTCIVEVRLHPHHTFASPPSYEMYIATGPDTKPLASKGVRRDPVYPMGVGANTSFIGVRLDATFPRADIDAAQDPRLVVMDEKANVLWQARLDLTRYR